MQPTEASKCSHLSCSCDTGDLGRLIWHEARFCSFHRISGLPCVYSSSQLSCFRALFLPLNLGALSQVFQALKSDFSSRRRDRCIRVDFSGGMVSGVDDLERMLRDAIKSTFEARAAAYDEQVTPWDPSMVQLYNLYTGQAASGCCCQSLTHER